MESLRKLDYELTILRPDDIVSSQLIAIRSNIANKTVKDILMNLAYDSSLGVRYIIFCNNPDKDMVHAFEADTPKELKNLLKSTQHICSECGYPLDKDDIKIVFVKKEVQVHY